MIKLVAIDMDGTLLKSDHTISDYTIKKLEEAREKGVKIVIATGRPLAGVIPYLKKLNLTSENDYVICFNGAIVQNVATEEIVGRAVLKGKDLKELYKVSQEIGVNLHAFSKEGCITPKMSRYSELEGEMNDIPVLVKDYNTVSDDEDIIKIMYVDKEEILSPVVSKMPQYLYDKFTVLRSTPYFLEFLNPTANKGVGLEKLAKYLGIKQEEIMAFGDAGNDEHLIEYAGIGVAMGNAFKEIKEIANYITASNEEDGVGVAIDKLILKEGEPYEKIKQHKTDK